MRLIKASSLLLTIAFAASSARAQNNYDHKSPDEPAKATAAAVSTAPTAAPAPASGAASANAPASKAEVEELRREVAELKATIQRLLEAEAHNSSSGAAPAAAKAEEPTSAHLMNAAAAAPAPPALAASSPAESQPEDADLFPFVQAAGAQKAAGTPVTAGWNGEHFFIKSADGQFQIQPYGYVQTDFRSYDGDGTPANSFAVRRARFGFQGNYGSHFQYAILTDAASAGTTPANSAIVRDVYLNGKVNDWFQIQAGQFKEPFAQEVTAGVTNIDFADRGLQSLLYPSAASAFRSPGAVIHGDLFGGDFQYWAGIFAGHGYATSTNTTSVPETVGRVRFYPWRKRKGSFLQEFAFGGSMAYSYARGLSAEQTPSMTQPDAAYTFFPQFRINGNVWRYNGEFTFLHGPWGFRDEYVQAFFDRTGVGTLQFGGLGFGNLPTVRFKAWDSAASYLLTGEKRPENGTPRVKHPLFGPETPGGGGKGWGAFELAFRYTGIQGNEPGIFFNNVLTPELVPTFNQHTDEFTVGINWYLNYWIRYQTNVSIDRLKQPSTIGAVPQNYLVFEQRIQFRF